MNRLLVDRLWNWSVSSAANATALGVDAIQTIEALTARRNRPDDDALANPVEAFEPGSQRVDDADWLVAQDEAWPDQVFAADEVHICSADCRRRDPDHRFAGPRRRRRHFFNGDVILPLNTTAFIVSMIPALRSHELGRPLLHLRDKRCTAPTALGTLITGTTCR
jgi:hypothetical protein